MRRFLLILGAFSFSIFLFGCSKTVATVNGQAITQQSLDTELERAGGKNMLESLVTKKLVEEDAAAKHVSATDQEVEQQFQDFKKTLGPTELQNLTPDKVQNLKDDLKFNILLRKAIMAKIPENEIQNFYNKNQDGLSEVELSAIVVADENQAKAISAELNQGKDFGTLAGQFSIDPAGRQRGGFVGYVPKGQLEQLSPALAQAAFALNVGQVSEPIKTPKGYYLLKVTNKKITFDQVKDEVERLMASERAKSYIDDLRDKAKIDYKGEYAKSK